MKTWIPYVCLAISLATAGMPSLAARTFLEDKEAQATRLLREVQIFQEQGEYDKARQLAEEVSQHATLIEALKETKKKHNWLWYRIAYAKYLGAETQASAEYRRAYTYSEEAGDWLHTKGNTQEAEDRITKGLEDIEKAISITKLKNAVQKSGKGRLEVVKKETIDRTTKKRVTTYVVRYIPNRRDCLWRIAEYDFVYGDPFKWKAIYEANRDKIDDPDLIYPGQKLTIPNIFEQKKE